MLQEVIYENITTKSSQILFFNLLIYMNHLQDNMQASQGACKIIQSPYTQALRTTKLSVNCF